MAVDTTDPMTKIADRQRTMMRNALERQALHEARLALASEGPEAAVEVLAQYATPYTRLMPIDRSAD